MTKGLQLTHGTTRETAALMQKPPIVIAEDFVSMRPEDTPDEMIAALEAEIAYADLSPEAQRIVDAGNVIAGEFPRDMTRDELSAWIINRFDIGR